MMVINRLSPLCAALPALRGALDERTVLCEAKPLVYAHRALVALLDVQEDRVDPIGPQGCHNGADAAACEAAPAMDRMGEDVADRANIITPRDEMHAGHRHQLALLLHAVKVSHRQ